MPHPGRPSRVGRPVGGSAAPVEPTDRPLHDPALGQNLEPDRLIRALDDLHRHRPAHTLQSIPKRWPLVATVCVKLQQKRVETKQRRHHPHPAITVLHISGMHQGVHQQTLRINEEVALLAFDFLTRVVARRVDRAPPFSAPFTLWLSMIAAVGLASRPACSRQRTYSVSWMRR